jgi:hypothetical protein
MNMRPAKAIILEEAGRVSSIPNISAFSKDGLASITFGTITSPSEAEAWSSRSVERRLVMGLDCEVELESALRFRAIQSVLHSTVQQCNLEQTVFGVRGESRSDT